MCKIEHEGEYHGVGQGLFFSGAATFSNSGSGHRTPGPTLRYVFDCGSEKYGKTLRREVDSYVSNFRDRSTPSVLSVLFISHLHWDHVSGLDYLLRELKKRNIRVRMAVLPYLYPEERALASSFTDEGTAQQQSPSPWYWRFINAPGTYLSKMGAEQVVYIRDGDDDGQMPFPEIVPVPPVDRGIEMHETAEEARVAILGPRASDAHNARIREWEALAQAETDIDQRTVYSSSNSLSAQWWFFVLFNKEPRPDKLKRFLDEAKRIRGHMPLRDLLDSAQRLARLKTAYAKLFGTRRLNDTSLAVLSGTALPGRGDYHLIREIRIRRRCDSPDIWSRSVEEWHDFPHHTRLHHLSHATVHTADLRVVDVWPQFARKFGLAPGPSMVDVFEYQVPHHGSAHNWHSAQAAIPSAPHYVIAAGKASRFGHPDSVVLRDLAQAGRSLSLVTEELGYSYSVEIMW